MKNTIQNKPMLVNSVFSSVHNKYDLMNDIMSFGIHRIWKNKLLDWMNPQLHNNLIDVASGTGDIAKLYSKRLIIPQLFHVLNLMQTCLRQEKNNLRNYKKYKLV